MTDLISSTQNSKVKLAHALQTRSKARKKERKIALEGLRLVRDAWQSGVEPAFVLHTGDTDTEFTDKLERIGIDVAAVDNEVMQYISETRSPQGIVGVFDTPQPEYPPAARQVLILDGIADPGNLGTILRTSSGAGVDAVVLAPGCVDLYNPKVLRSGMGAHFRIPVLEMNWAQIGVEVGVEAFYLADGSATLAYDAVDWKNTSWALITGSEAHGASDEAQALATETILIPMANATESLNAAMATAVILFEARRQCRH